MDKPEYATSLSPEPAAPAKYSCDPLCTATAHHIFCPNHESSAAPAPKAEDTAVEPFDHEYESDLVSYDAMPYGITMDLMLKAQVRCRERQLRATKKRLEEAEAALSAIRDAPIPEMPVLWHHGCQEAGFNSDYYLPDQVNPILTALTQQVAALKAENAKLKAKGDAGGWIAGWCSSCDRMTSAGTVGDGKPCCDMCGDWLIFAENDSDADDAPLSTPYGSKGDKMKPFLALFLLAFPVWGQQAKTAKTVWPKVAGHAQGILMPEQQAAYPANAWIKPCGKDNRDDWCVEQAKPGPIGDPPCSMSGSTVIPCPSTHPVKVQAKPTPKPQPLQVKPGTNGSGAGDVLSAPSNATYISGFALAEPPNATWEHHVKDGVYTATFTDSGNHWRCSVTSMFGTEHGFSAKTTAFTVTCIDMAEQEPVPTESK